MFRRWPGCRWGGCWLGSVAGVPGCPGCPGESVVAGVRRLAVKAAGGLLGCPGVPWWLGVGAGSRERGGGVAGSGAGGRHFPQERDRELGNARECAGGGCVPGVPGRERAGGSERRESPPGGEVLAGCRGVPGGAGGGSRCLLQGGSAGCAGGFPQGGMRFAPYLRYGAMLVQVGLGVVLVSRRGVFPSGPPFDTLRLTISDPT